MRVDCLPFTQIPHTTRLFADLLYAFSKVKKFYSRPPDLKQWVREEAGRISYDPARRERVAAILERQNLDLGASPETLNNIRRLRAGASCVVTGQQVGLCGGPPFAVFKAISALKLAAEAAAQGCDSVPVFWLATEDHDLAEVNHATLLAPNGTLHTLRTEAHGPTENSPISLVRLGEDVRTLVEEAAEVLGDVEVVEILRRAYKPGETLGGAFARLFTTVLGRWGVVMLDASDPELHGIAQPIYAAAIEHAADLDEALLQRGKELTAGGYHEQVKVTPRSTLLFVLRDGARLVIHRSDGANGDLFRVGSEKISKQELLRQIVAAPHQFSPNVLLRPVVQDYLLPTLAYTGGPSECAYFAQAGVVYEWLLKRVTPVLPRLSATLVGRHEQRLLKKYQLKLPDLFHGPEHLRELLAARALPRDLQKAFDEAQRSLQESLQAIERELRKLDSTLVDAAERAGAKMRHQVERLRSKAARAELARSAVLDRHAAQLSNSLYPHKGLQEREIAGVSFLARYGLDLVENLLDKANAGCPDHQVIYL